MSPGTNLSFSFKSIDLQPPSFVYEKSGSAGPETPAEKAWPVIEPTIKDLAYAEKSLDELSGQASRQVDGDLVADVFAKPLAELGAEREHMAAPAGDHQSYIRKLDPVNGSVHTDGLPSAEELCRTRHLHARPQLALDVDADWRSKGVVERPRLEIVFHALRRLVIHSFNEVSPDDFRSSEFHRGPRPQQS